jgi:soluble lytic murein transglycosylase-like protein
LSGLLEVPEVNVHLGTNYLAELLRDNGGSLTLALASYNAGSQQVRRWKERYGVTDEEEFTENIPYAETRNYVKRVLGSYQRYATLYAPRAGYPRGGQEPGTGNPLGGVAENKKPKAESRKPEGK